MFGNFFKRASLKASFYNIKCDCVRVRHTYAISGKRASKHLVMLMDNVRLALQDGASADDIRKVVAESASGHPELLADILMAAVDMKIHALSGEQRLSELAAVELLVKFQEANGERFTMD